MRIGAGTVLARKYGAREIVDPRPYAAGSIKTTFEAYPNVGALLPAMGYSPAQIRDLEGTIDRTPCEVVVVGTPVDLTRLMTIHHPTVRVRYDLQEIGRPDLGEVMAAFLARVRPAVPA
jgi:predicted GTPase